MSENFLKKYPLICLSAFNSEIITFPIDSTKTRMQILSNSNFFNIFNKHLKDRSIYNRLKFALGRQFIYSGARLYSYEKIKTSSIQSRAIGAIINHTYVFSLPGSTGACKDGWNEILKYQLDIRHKPCNFVEIMPRLKEK